MKALFQAAEWTRFLHSRSKLLAGTLFLATLAGGLALTLRPALAGVSDATSKELDPWFLTGSDPGSYRIGIDREGLGHGHAAAFLQSTVQQPAGFGTIMQSIAAAKYAGKRIRFEASVRSENVSDWAGLWMRINRGTAIVGFDNMQKRPIKGSQGWTRYDVVLDVPADATDISFGALLTGPGELWLSQVKFDSVGADVATTSPTAKDSLPSEPGNLSFGR